jgi:hypothetical protein
LSHHESTHTVTVARGDRHPAKIFSMQTHWFKRWGWFYRPVSWQGVGGSLLALAFCVQTFIALDRHSHSASDTLYHFYLYAVTTFLLLMWVAARTSGEVKGD